MGTAEIQGNLWGSRALDWADYGESTSDDLFNYIQKKLGQGNNRKLLDIGCGAGKFCRIANDNGFLTTGFDASKNLIEIAKERLPKVEFICGDMENLPFPEKYFDIVCAFNSFQYAESIQNSLSEALKVTKQGGMIIIVIWNNPDKCDATSIFSALAPYMPPPPFHNNKKPLFIDGEMEGMISNAGIQHISTDAVDCYWRFENEETALKAILSAGVIQLAINNAGIEKITETISTAIKPYKNNKGKYILKNSFKCLFNAA